MLFGLGYVNIDWEQAFKESGVADEIYVEDNGIYGIAFFYGLFGVLWCVVLTVRAGVMAYKLFRLDGNVAPLCYLIVSVLGIKTLAPNCYENTAAYQLCLIMIECELEQKLASAEAESRTGAPVLLNMEESV